MDDLEHWASMVPSAAESARAMKEYREQALKAAFTTIKAEIDGQRGQGNGCAYIRALEIPRAYTQDVVAVLKHQGYKISGIAVHSAGTLDLDISWEPQVQQQEPAVPKEVICGVELHGRGRSRPFCDLLKGHPGRCTADTLSKPRCDTHYEYRSGPDMVKGFCGLPQGHKGEHYSLAERDALPIWAGVPLGRRCGERFDYDDGVMCCTGTCALHQGHTGQHATKRHIEEEGLPGPARD